MKYWIVAGLIILSGLAQAETFRKGQHVYDRVFQTAMYISSIHGDYYYVQHFRGDEMQYPRVAEDLSPRVSSAGRISEDMEVSYFNRNDRRWYFDTVKMVFANGVAYFSGTLGKYAVGQSYLGTPVSKVEGSNLKVGSKVCAIKRTTHLKKAGASGTIVKLFSNGSAKVKFYDFFIANYYEAIPLDNLRPCSK